MKALAFPRPTSLLSPAERQLVVATHALKAILSEPEKAKALSMEALTRIRQISEDQMETP